MTRRTVTISARPHCKTCGVPIAFSFANEKRFNGNCWNCCQKSTTLTRGRFKDQAMRGWPDKERER